MNTLIGDCLALGIHDAYILAALLTTFGVLLLLALWLVVERRQLLAAVAAQQTAAARAGGSDGWRRELRCGMLCRSRTRPASKA